VAMGVIPRSHPATRSRARASTRSDAPAGGDGEARR
jgi:hypothetical protein